jgi:hypothetical protein
MVINCLSNKPDGDYIKLLNGGFTNNNIELKNSQIDGAGVGVFAKKDFKKDKIVERCPILIMSPHNQTDPMILKYSFAYNCDCDICKKRGTLAILPLGYGGMYNTSLSKDESNIDYYININSKVLVNYARKNIKAGEELLTFYGVYHISAFIGAQEMVRVN